MRKMIPVYCLLAGLCDACTGLLLVSVPALTLRLMGIAEIPADVIFLRFVGVFVGSVGLAYLYPLALNRPAGRIRTVFEVTALIRLSVALFIAISVTTGALSLPWLSVFFTDLGLALFQLCVLRGALRKVDP